MEKLFSKIQLQEITEDARKNFEHYHDCYCINGNATESSIKKISKIKHLIFVEGNEHTGFSHLNDRHNYFSNENYWILADYGNFKLDNPSKFNSEMIPINDYVRIADTIFCDENKNITKNNRPDLFDKYTGNFTFLDGQPEKYHLLTYKDTKIVHTFFPDKKKHNRKVKCRYGKGIVSTKLKFPDAINDLLVPYENKDGMVVYSILIRKYYLEKVERLIVQKHDETGTITHQYFLGSRDFEQFEKFEREDLFRFQNGDLTTFEEIINDLEKHGDR